MRQELTVALADLEELAGLEGRARERANTAHATWRGLYDRHDLTIRERRKQEELITGLTQELVDLAR